VLDQRQKRLMMSISGRLPGGSRGIEQIHEPRHPSVPGRLLER
jgi:hypothetical protein